MGARQSREFLVNSWEEVSSSAHRTLATAKIAEDTTRDHKQRITDVQSTACEAEAAHERSVAALRAQQKDIDGFSELPALWRDRSAAPPMAAYDETKDLIYEDAECSIPQVAIDSSKRPTEEELVTQFRLLAKDNQPAEAEVSKQLSTKRIVPMIRGAPLREVQASALNIGAP